MERMKMNWHFGETVYEKNFDVQNINLLSESLAPNPIAILVDRSEPDRRGFSGAPTRDGSLPERSFENERHSVPTSTRLNIFL